MSHDSYDDRYIRGILNTVESIAMVGVSANTSRPSYFAVDFRSTPRENFRLCGRHAIAHRGIMRAVWSRRKPLEERMLRSMSLAVAIALGAMEGATAQTRDDQAACQDDAFRVCSHTIPDRERTFQCMIAQRDTLSAACRAAIANYLPPEPAPQKISTRRAKALSQSASREPGSPGRRTKKGPTDLAPPGR
jgi:hypothetical protein